MTPDLFTRTPVPVPSGPFHVAATDDRAAVCRKLDLLFEDVISVYAEEVRQLLLAMYYHGDNVETRSGLLQSGFEANWYSLEVEGAIVHVMTVDEALQRCPLILRMLKVHEIGVHIGQAYTRETEVGAERFLEELQDGLFHRFSEMCAALLDKLMTDSIPEKLLEAELADPALRAAVLPSYARLRALSPEDAARLRYRPDSALPQEYDALHARPEVRKFCVIMLRNKGFSPLPFIGRSQSP